MQFHTGLYWLQPHYWLLLPHLHTEHRMAYRKCFLFLTYTFPWHRLYNCYYLGNSPGYTNNFFCLLLSLNFSHTQTPTGRHRTLNNLGTFHIRPFHLFCMYRTGTACIDCFQNRYLPDICYILSLP